MDAFAAGRLSRTFDAIHSASYFVPEVGERYGEAGFRGRTSYFAVRSAPMGAVGPATVAATFYNFNPELIAGAIPMAWQLLPPDEVTRIRYEIVDEALPKVLGDVARSKEFARAADLLRGAAEAIPSGAGRPLYAAHAALPWPDSVHARLWHAVTLLREYRGDGHIAALVGHRLSGLDALLTHTLAGIGFSVDYARLLRGWSEEAWAAGVDALRERGLVAADDTLTDAGVELRSQVEDLTDELGYAPWRTLTDAQVDELTPVATAIRAAVRESGVIPSQAFGPRYGEHR